MITWITADHHFGHANIIKYCNRPFNSVEEMDDTMIRRWNELVDKKDTVISVGDFSMNRQSAIRSLDELNGTICLIPGSHDDWIESLGAGTLRFKLFPKLYEKKFPFGSEKVMIVMCHYAMRVWNLSHYGSYHFYGHSHGTLPGVGRSIDVGVDGNNFYPYNYIELLFKLENEKNVNQLPS
jgi:calcineurin-like phosphoesterase family protein